MLHESIAIITDVPLEKMMEHLPPIKSPVETIDIKIDGEFIPMGTDVLMPYVYKERLAHGCIHLVYLGLGPVSIKHGVKEPPYVGEIKALVDSGSEQWYEYGFVSTEYPSYELHLMMFVYWYLANGGKNIILYRQMDMPSFGPETPVSKVDISNKLPGQTPMCSRLIHDVLYWFFDSKNTAKNHDTAILERIAEDKDLDFCYPKRALRRPHDDLTLGELMKICGNAAAYTEVYDYDKLLDTWNEEYQAKADENTEEKPPVKPLESVEIITDMPKFWEKEKDEWVGPPCTKGPSIYEDCPVRFYTFYSYNALDSLQLTDEVYLDSSFIYVDKLSIGLAAVVDTKYKKDAEQE